MRSYLQFTFWRLSTCSLLPTRLKCGAILVGEARFLLSVQFLESRVHFPAIKTHSVPNLLARSTATVEQSIRTEKSNSAGARYDRGPRNKRWHQFTRKSFVLDHSWFCPNCTFFKVIQCPGISSFFQWRKHCIRLHIRSSIGESLLLLYVTLTNSQELLCNLT